MAIHDTGCHLELIVNDQHSCHCERCFFGVTKQGTGNSLLRYQVKLDIGTDLCHRSTHEQRSEDEPDPFGCILSVMEYDNKLRLMAVTIPYRLCYSKQ